MIRRPLSRALLAVVATVGAVVLPSPAGAAATVPGAPGTPTASAGDGSATLSWTAPGDDGGSGVTGYTVQFASPSPGPATTSPAMIDGSTLTATVTGLTNGTAYTFTVTASNAQGPGPASRASSSVVPARVPDAPTDVAAHPTSDTAATVTWSAPANNGAAVTSYTVTSSPDGRTATSTATDATVGGLTAGTTYTFTVTASNAVGDSAPSAASAPERQPVLSGPPTITAVQPGDAKLVVSFTGSTTGDVPTSYTVTATATPGGQAVSVSTTSSPVTVAGLADGVGYRVTVKPSDGGVFGTSSPVSDEVVPEARVVPTILGPTTVRRGGLVTLTGRVAHLDGTVPAGAGPLRLVQRLQGQSPAADTVKALVPVDVVGDWSITFRATRSAGYAVSTTLGDADGSYAATSPFRSVSVPVAVVGVAVVERQGVLVVTGALTPGQQRPVAGAYATVQLWSATKGGTLRSLLATAKATKIRAAAGSPYGVSLFTLTRKHAPVGTLHLVVVVASAAQNAGGRSAPKTFVVR